MAKIVVAELSHGLAAKMGARVAKQIRKLLQGAAASGIAGAERSLPQKKWWQFENTTGILNGENHIMNALACVPLVLALLLLVAYTC